jgi:NAD(P)H-nitrite reductase large subunit
MKNFVRLCEQGDFTGNNCGKSWTGEDRSTLRCKYGDGADHRRLTVADPLVAGSLIFGEASDEANLMSYISTNTDDGVRRKRHLTQRQRDLIRLGSRMPSRQCLRNFAP